MKFLARLGLLMWFALGSGAAVAESVFEWQLKNVEFVAAQLKFCKTKNKTYSLQKDVDALLAEYRTHPAGTRFFKMVAGSEERIQWLIETFGPGWERFSIGGLGTCNEQDQFWKKTIQVATAFLTRENRQATAPAPVVDSELQTALQDSERHIALLRLCAPLDLPAETMVEMMELRRDILEWAWPTTARVRQAVSDQRIQELYERLKLSAADPRSELGQKDCKQSVEEAGKAAVVLRQYLLSKR